MQQWNLSKTDIWTKVVRLSKISPGADLDHVTYGLWRTKILPSCSKSFKIVEYLVLILILIQIWRIRKLFLNPPHCRILFILKKIFYILRFIANFTFDWFRILTSGILAKACDIHHWRINSIQDTPFSITWIFYW